MRAARLRAWFLLGPARATAARGVRPGLLFVILVGMTFPAGAAAGGSQPAVPSLEAYDAKVRQQPTQVSDLAQPLPRALTICVDRTAQRCWSEAGATDCRDPAGHAEVFRVVPVSESQPDAGTALKKCWTQFER